MEPFIARPLGFCTVPGNHDLYLADTLRERRFERHFGDLLHERSARVRRRRCVSRSCAWWASELAVVGVNSAKPNPVRSPPPGRVPERAARGPGARCSSIPARAALRDLVITHYGILRPRRTARLRPPRARERAGAAAHLHATARGSAARAHPPPLLPSPDGRASLAVLRRQRDPRGREGLWVYEFEGEVACVRSRAAGIARRYRLEPRRRGSNLSVDQGPDLRFRWPAARSGRSIVRRMAG